MPRPPFTPETIYFQREPRVAPGVRFSSWAIDNPAVNAKPRHARRAEKPHPDPARATGCVGDAVVRACTSATAAARLWPGLENQRCGPGNLSGDLRGSRSAPAKPARFILAWVDSSQ